LRAIRFIQMLLSRHRRIERTHQPATRTILARHSR
jgi:hypothetical protein